MMALPLHVTGLTSLRVWEIMSRGKRRGSKVVSEVRGMGSKIQPSACDRSHSHGHARVGVGWILSATLVVHSACAAGQGPVVSGELKKWHTVTISFTGPRTSEAAMPNPFRDYRLNVAFTRGDKSHLVPGHYAADGNTAETGADSGDVWRVHFAPDEEGEWRFVASFRKGADVAISTDPNAGEATAFDAARGSFTVGPTDKKGRDHRAKGRLRYVGKHYLQFAETGDYFLKGGADSPENFLAYFEFDGTHRHGQAGGRRRGEASAGKLHRYHPHARDWRRGDPTWRDGKGKNIIGSLNYLASKGMNSVYFLTMNVKGDGKDVWPWTAEDERYRFDCSKLDQWEIVFSHMDRLGIMLHVLTQETENDQLLDGGALGTQRKLYYRELIARFAHHLAITWNLGEENTNTDEQRKAFASYVRALDPYDHFIACHTFPGRYDQVYTPLLGYEHFDGPSLQTNATHEQTIRWIDRSAAAGRKWVVCLDEIGPANTGVKPDVDDYMHDEVRQRHLWGNLMAGGAGCEWYFGYKFPRNDLNCEDWRSRDHLWELTRLALEFFQQHLPFVEMQHADGFTSASGDYCFAKSGEIYAIYLPDGGATKLDLKTSPASYTVRWFNPRLGGSLDKGTVHTITGPGQVSIGMPPSEWDKDWAALLKRTSEVKSYKLTVNGGAGSGTYPVGSAVDIAAGPAPKGKAFLHWAGDVRTIEDVRSPRTTLLMPGADATLSATYGERPPEPPPSARPAVVSFTLINAETDSPIAGFDPIPHGATIDLSKLPTKKLNIRANTAPRKVGSVRFGYGGDANVRTESVPPYAFASDQQGDYRAWTPERGTHTLKATPYAERNASGAAGKPLSVTFRVR
jgi:hypothetical protein